MSTIVATNAESSPFKNLNLLSLDAGGPKGISQLKILSKVVESLSHNPSGDPGEGVKRPCEIFHAIGGVGTGGLISIFLVILKMTAAQALEEFTDLVGLVFKEVVPDPKKQTEKLKSAIEGILERYKIPKGKEIIQSGQLSLACKLIIPIMYSKHVGAPCILKNYITGNEPPINLTIAEAMLATCATPPIFTPTNIEKDSATFEYVGGDVGLSNPTREIIAEAHHAFGGDATVACLLSLGSGHTGVNAVPRNSNTVAWVEFLDRITKDSEKTAQEMASQMKGHTLYHRLSVDIGMDDLDSDLSKDPTIISTVTTAYLDGFKGSELLQRCVETIDHGDGFATLEQLKHSGGTKVLPPDMPALTSHYVERKEATTFVENALFDQNGAIKPGSKIIVVTGIGGCGKTQLIRKFVEQYEERFADVFFIDGSSEGAFKRGIVRSVRSLGPAHSQKSFGDSMAFLSQPITGQRLIVIDNVDTPAIVIARMLPRWRSGAVIVTSRDRSRGQLSPSHLELDVMSQEEAVELLVRGSGRAWPPSQSDKEAAIAVAKELGCHPIALIQAISYMSNTGCSAETYINRLRSSRETLLKTRAENQVEMRYETAFASFDASYGLLPPQAQKVLHLLSFFHWRNFCLELVGLAAEDDFSTDYYNFLPHGEDFERGKEYLASIFCSSGQWSPLTLDTLIRSLRNHSLVTVVSTENVTLLQMHPLVHEWARYRSSLSEHDDSQRAAIRLLCCGAVEKNRSMIQHLYHHVRALSPAWNGLHVNDKLSFAFILNESGLYSAAANLIKAGHEVLAALLGVNDLRTISASASLATTYGELGRYIDAERLQKEVLDRRKELLGVGHPATITASANLVLTYNQLGRYGEAEELGKEVFDRRKELLGLSHLDTIMASANLAYTYNQLGRYGEAERLEKEVLDRRKELLGVNDPHTIVASANLASTYNRLGRYGEAERLEKEVLDRRKKLLGLDHPDTIAASANLAATYNQLGRYGDAEELRKEVLRRSTALLGVDHPDTIAASASLAATYCELGRYTEAEVLEKEVLDRRKELLGVGHPGTITASENLAATYCELGWYTKAEVLAKEALDQRRGLLGVNHLSTIRASANLAAIYNKLGLYGEAETLEKEVLDRRTELLGVDHPSTIRALANLAVTYNQLRRYGEAERLGREVLRQRKEIMGLDHPDTILASGNLARTLYELGNYTEAVQLQRVVLGQRREILGERHPDTLHAMCNLAKTCKAMQCRPEAVDLARNATQMLSDTLGQTHPLYLEASAFLATLDTATLS